MGKARTKSPKPRRIPGDAGARHELRPGDIELIKNAAPGYHVAQVAKPASDCMLERLRYARIPLLTGRQFDAGMQLRETWDLAARQPRVVAKYEPSIPGGEDDMPARVTRAKRELAALLAILLPAEKDVVEDVCRNDYVAAGRMNLLRDGLDWIGDKLDLECLKPEAEERLERVRSLDGRLVRVGAIGAMERERV